MTFVRCTRLTNDTSNEKRGHGVSHVNGPRRPLTDCGLNGPRYH